MALAERPWFYRIWTWQEIKLGTAGAGRDAVLQCGGASVAWHDFWLAVLCLNNKNAALLTSLPAELPPVELLRFRERCRHIVFLQHGGETQSLANLLDVARSKGCADPRDKIFGLLGITPPYFRAGTAVVVDYRRPAPDVYRDAFLAHSRATLRLDLLKHCDLAAHDVESSDAPSPSWVPDWSRTEFAAPVLSEQLATGISRAWFTHRGDVLEVLGVRHATVAAVSSRAAAKVEDKTLCVVREWREQFCSPASGTYPLTGETLDQAFVLALCMDRTRERNPGNHNLDEAQWVAMLRRIVRLGEGEDAAALYAEREIANTIQKVRGRRFFRTADGLFGTAPAGVQVGM
ncbi:hypothetical protein B0T26DRAFT_725169 [Lasiosphaeria miniovina]|uniref:Uncharacterized protein n=1 Tax=Lasiosphaeria miniovina TaxID=1954250 RepID=A0AA40DLU5_9PEZI|nr:uncharacterized protein B0T26DRAFT_725169 [Lasiosphaeria miniovina]KAK0705996.1 hypothetical protein B0T26DRAFT_725169 [Lasiosphaeria miniovina]